MKIPRLQASNQERRIYQGFFDRLDRSPNVVAPLSLTRFPSLQDHDGKITLEEFLQGVKENRKEEGVLSEEEARKTFNEWDMNGDGVIDGKEFWNVMMIKKRGSSLEIMKDLWERFDEDKDGFIDKEDVVRFFDKLFGRGQIDNPEALNVLFDEYDTDHDGKLNFGDFIPFSEKLFGES
ncbi:hypothetical protein FRC01_001329 [Tulasnella sp. 417]|nr:hypothetical protein FRC01_001329 [Tulasnella sp. 417]